MERVHKISLLRIIKLQDAFRKVFGKNVRTTNSVYQRDFFRTFSSFPRPSMLCPLALGSWSNYPPPLYFVCRFAVVFPIAVGPLSILWSMPPSADHHHRSQQVPLSNLFPSPKAWGAGRGWARQFRAIPGKDSKWIKMSELRQIREESEVWHGSCQLWEGRRPSVSASTS